MRRPVDPAYLPRHAVPCVPPSLRPVGLSDIAAWEAAATDLYSVAAPCPVDGATTGQRAYTLAGALALGFALGLWTVAIAG